MSSTVLNSSSNGSNRSNKPSKEKALQDTTNRKTKPREVYPVLDPVKENDHRLLKHPRTEENIKVLIPSPGGSTMTEKDGIRVCMDVRDAADLSRQAPSKGAFSRIQDFVNPSHRLANALKATNADMRGIVTSMTKERLEQEEARDTDIIEALTDDTSDPPNQPIVDQTEATMANEEDGLQEEVVALSNNNNGLAVQLNLAQNEATGLQDEVDSLAIDNINPTIRVNDAQTQTEAPGLQEQVDFLTDDKNELTIQRNDAQYEAACLQEQVDILTDDKYDLTIQRNHAQYEATGLQEELDTVTLAVSDDNNDLIIQVIDAQRQVDTLMDEKNDLAIQLFSAENEAFNLQEELNAAQDKNASIAQDHDAFINALSQRFDQRFAEMEARVARIPALEARVTELETDNARIPGLEAHVARIPGLEAQVARIPGLEDRVTELETDVAKLEVDNATMQLRLDHLDPLSADARRFNQ